MEERDKYVGQIIDNRYKVEKNIGNGGMAVVFKAEDIELNKTVAIKMLKEEKRSDPSYMKSFINEARAVAMLNHENIMQIYDVSVKENMQYIVMEHIEGMTLKTYLGKKGGILDWREVLNITEQILRALDHAHSKKIIHRDIKPQNIMLLKNGLIKVADFGIAKLPGSDTLTATNKAIGTVHYISPEQARGEATDSKSDLYSVGVLMYELACGRLPFTADTPVAVALKHIEETAEPPCSVNSMLPAGMQDIIVRAMEKDPAMRYQSARSMLKHIAALRENENIRFHLPSELQKQEQDKKQDNKKEEEPKEKEEKVRTIVEGKSIMPIVLGVLSAFMIVAIIVAFLVFDKLSGMMNDTTAKELVVNDYIGQVYNDVLRAQMEAEGYRITVKEGTASDDISINQIVSQNPEQGKKVKYIPGEKPVDITLYIYKGSDTIKLPDLSLREYESVRNEYINVYQFKIVKEYNDVVPKGYIVRTEPAMGSDVAIGSEITLYVSDGTNVKTVRMESLVEKKSDEAHKWIKDNGLKLGYIKFEENDLPEGRVISQSIAAGKDVALGTPVDLVISLGKTYTEAQEPSLATETEQEDETSSSGWFDWFPGWH